MIKMFVLWLIALACFSWGCILYIDRQFSKRLPEEKIHCFNINLTLKEPPLVDEELEDITFQEISVTI